MYDYHYGVPGTSLKKKTAAKIVTRGVLRSGKLNQRQSLLSNSIRSQKQQGLQRWHEGAYRAVALVVRACTVPICDMKHEVIFYCAGERFSLTASKPKKVELLSIFNL